MRRIGSVLALMCLGLVILSTGVAVGQPTGSIVGWGYCDWGQCSAPAPNADFKALAGGYYHSLGVKSNGTIVAWGSNTSGQCNIPAPNANFVAAAGGFGHSLGLKTDGTIVAWGWNTEGQCDVPTPNENFVAVAAGPTYSLGLKSDGTIVGWGLNDHGQCDAPAPNADFVAIAGGSHHSLALKSDGTIVAWGWNGEGECDVPEPNDGFVAVAAGWWHSVGLKADGTIVAWGENDEGECDLPASNADFVAVAAGEKHSLGLKTDGTIVAWGKNDRGQCDVPAPNADFVAVARGGLHSQGLKRSPTSCAIPEIVSFDPLFVNSDNCATGCPVAFSVSTQDDYSQVQKITLERILLGTWVEEDSIGAPVGDPDPDWTLTCLIDHHYTDGPHTFRVVFHCQDGSKDYSFPVFVDAERGVPVLITGFEREYCDEGVILHWTIGGAADLQGFNIYRSLEKEEGYKRINEGLISPDGRNEYIDDGVVPGETYWYRLGAVDEDGEWMSQTLSLIVPLGSLALHQNHPNPFNPTTTISFTLPERVQTRLSIYDITGKRVATLVDQVLEGGLKVVTWNGRDDRGNPVSSGIYFYRLTSGNRTLEKKMVFLK